jgi:hypothetical protein
MIHSHAALIFSTVLAGFMIPAEDVLLGKLNVHTLRYAHEKKEPYHRWNIEGHAHRTDTKIRPLHNLRLAGPNHDNGPFGGTHGEGFEIIVEKKNVPVEHYRFGASDLVLWIISSVTNFLP